MHESEDELQRKAEAIYEKMYAKTPEIGGGENPMASNLYEFITFCAFYEASDHRINENAVAYISEWMMQDQRLLGKLIDLKKILCSADEMDPESMHSFYCKEKRIREMGQKEYFSC